jgi:hypothetical protein
VHTNGAREYDVHNLYGTAMALEHHAAVEKITGKRPFLLTRCENNKNLGHPRLSCTVTLCHTVQRLLWSAMSQQTKACDSWQRRDVPRLFI